MSVGRTALAVVIACLLFYSLCACGYVVCMGKVVVNVHGEETSALEVSVPPAPVVSCPVL